MQKVLQRHLVVTDVPDDIAEPFNLLGGLVTASGDEPLHIHHCAGQIRQCPVKV